MLFTISVIRDYIRAYYDAVYRSGYFLVIAAMLAAIIFVNYHFRAYPNNTRAGGFMADYLLYLLPFAMAYLLQWFYFKQDRSGFSKPWFWIILFSAPALFACRIHLNLPAIFPASFAPEAANRYWVAIINYILKILVLMVPVMFIWYIKDRPLYRLYGFVPARHSRLYIYLLLLMVPLVAVAAFLPGFLQTYPRAMHFSGLDASGSTGQFLLFELVYAADFLSIEFFFRGFLIITFIRYFGMRAIVPAACFYCCIHLGKPMAEAISSFFGGLLLGIITYHTLSIRGGLFIHIGIAWLMEIAAGLVHHF